MGGGQILKDFYSFCVILLQCYLYVLVFAIVGNQSSAVRRTRLEMYSSVDDSQHS